MKRTAHVHRHRKLIDHIYDLHDAGLKGQGNEVLMPILDFLGSYA